MGTVPDGCEVSRKGLSPLDQLPIAPLGTGPVGASGHQQVQSPMAKYPVDSFQELPVTGCRLPVDSSQSPMSLAEKGRALPILSCRIQWGLYLTAAK